MVIYDDQIWSKIDEVAEQVEQVAKLNHIQPSWLILGKVSIKQLQDFDPDAEFEPSF